MTYSYFMLPVLISQLKEQRECPINLVSYIANARLELTAKEIALVKRQTQFGLQMRRRDERRFTDALFDAERREILSGFEALKGLEVFARSTEPVFLSEALADYGASEIHWEQLVRLRKRLPASLQEDFQRAAA